MSLYFDFTTDLVDRSGDDFDFENIIFDFTSGPEIIDPSPLYFLFIGDSPSGPPPETIYDFSQGIILSFRDPRALNPFNAKSVAGLDAGLINPKYYKSASGDKFYTLYMRNRNLVFRIGLNPDFSDDETFSELRDAIYKVISASKSGTVDIYFKDGDVIVAKVTGFATKLETTLFERTQEALLTVNCEDPMLRSPSPVLIPFDTIGFDDVVIQDDRSTAPHGITFQLKFTSNPADLTITDPTDDSWMFKVVPAGGFFNGDVLYFSSEYSRKQLYITRGAFVIDLLSKVTLDSIWPIIFPGENHFSLSNGSALDWLALSHYETYWGV